MNHPSFVSYDANSSLFPIANERFSQQLAEPHAYHATHSKPLSASPGQFEPTFSNQFSLNPTPQIYNIPSFNLNSNEIYNTDIDTEAMSRNTSGSSQTSSHDDGLLVNNVHVINTSSTYTKLIARACEATNDEPLVRFISSCFNEEIEKRRATNRISAKRSRDRRRLKYVKLEEENEVLALKNDALSLENKRLQAEIQRVSKLLAQVQSQHDQPPRWSSQEEPSTSTVPLSSVPKDGIRDTTAVSSLKRKRT